MRGQGGRQHARVPALDGIRGLAVAAVVLFHAEAGVATGGFLGVSAFFTLSGFLITSLLVAERRSTGRVALGAFWARRARRLLPAAAVALGGIVVFGATVADADQIRDLRGDVMSAIGYVANWRFLFDGRAYTELFSAPSPVQHFWSLAIEEQFYVLFPLFVVGALRLGRGRTAPLAGLLIAAAVGSVVAGRALADDTMRVYYGTDTRVSELLIGALLAIVCARWPGPRTQAARFALGGAGIAAFSVLVWWWVTVEQSDRWLYEGGFALHALLTAVVIAAALSDTPLSRALANKPLIGLGLISYGVYLYHWPIFLWLSPERLDLPWVALLAIRCAVTLAAAIASYHLIEMPVRQGRRIRGAWPPVLTPAATGALVAALFVATASPPRPPFTLEPIADRPPVAEAEAFAAAPAPVPVPTTPPGPIDYYRPLEAPRPLRALVVGDSVGLTFGRGMELWAAETGAAVVRNEAREWCSLGRDLPLIQGPGGKASPSEECHNWDERWARTIEEFDPDVVFVMYTVWEVAPRLLPGASDYAKPGDPALDAWQRSEYQAAADVLSARGARVNWFTMPCTDTPISEGEPIWHVNKHTLPALAKTRDLVRLVDLDAELCPGGQPTSAYGGVDDFRPDHAHFSDDGALAVARWVMTKVQGQAQVPPIEQAATGRALHRPLEAAGPLRAMVVGDSVGLTLGRGLERWAQNTGRAVVRNEARKFCSLGRYAPRQAGFSEGEQGPACDEWENRWTRAIEGFDPDVVFVLYTVWEMAPRQVPGSSDFLPPGDARFDAWQLSEYEAAADVLSARGARVVWLTIPCGRDERSGRDTAIGHVNRTITRLSYARESVSVVDLDAELCPDHSWRSDYRGVDPARPDGAHFSDPGAHAVADWLMGSVLDVV